MAVEIINRRILKASTEVRVSELQQLIAGLDGDQKVKLDVHKGYSDFREHEPDSVTMTIDNPRPAGPIMRGSGRPVETL